MSNNLETTTKQETPKDTYKEVDGEGMVLASAIIGGTVILVASYYYTKRKIKQFKNYINNKLDNMCM